MTINQKTRSQEVAETIIQTLGGPGRLKITINAHTFICGTTEEGNPCLTFRHMTGGPKGGKINLTKITLDPSDTYTVELGYVRMPNYTVRVTHSMVYCDMLQDIWESETGLRLSLGTMGR